MSLSNAFEAATALADLVERPKARRVLRISVAGACDNAITVHLPGCNLRCVHCWAGVDRDFPERTDWLDYKTLAKKINTYRRENRLGAAPDRIRLSGGEPILSPGFFDLLESLLILPGTVYIETNGVVLGSREDWFTELSRHASRLFFKVSLKAGLAEQFEHITGAEREAWESTWNCVSLLHRHEIPFDLNALTLSSRLFSPSERQMLLQRLSGISEKLVERLEEETLTDYPATSRRMQHWKRRSRSSDIETLD